MTKKEVTFPSKPSGSSVDFPAETKQQIDRVLSEPMKRVCVDIPKSLHLRIKVQCAQEGVHLSEVTRAF